MNSKYVLFLVVEPDNTTATLKFQKAYNFEELGDYIISYEKEALYCIQFWRSKKNNLRDIEIIIINPTKEELSENTLKEFKKYNVNYIKKYFPECDKYICRWNNIPIVGKWLENNTNKIIIHIDLDMFLLKSIPEKFLDIRDNELAICAAYPGNIHDDGRTRGNYTLYSVTCFIISQPSKKFYTKWLLYLEKYVKELGEFDGKKYFDLEEHVVDIMKYENNYSIRYVTDLMLGRTYHKLEKIDNKIFPNICFIHEHIKEIDSIVNTAIGYRNYEKKFSKQS